MRYVSGTKLMNEPSHCNHLSAKKIGNVASARSFRVLVEFITWKSVICQRLDDCQPQVHARALHTTTDEIRWYFIPMISLELDSNVAQIWFELFFFLLFSSICFSLAFFGSKNEFVASSYRAQKEQKSTRSSKIISSLCDKIGISTLTGPFNGDDDRMIAVDEHRTAKCRKWNNFSLEMRLDFWEFFFDSNSALTRYYW